MINGVWNMSDLFSPLGLCLLVWKGEEIGCFLGVLCQSLAYSFFPFGMSILPIALPRFS
jgi:hypothetical protein